MKYEKINLIIPIVMFTLTITSSKKNILGIASLK